MLNNVNADKAKINFFAYTKKAFFAINANLF